MGSFPGLLICATNALDTLDAAALRRLHTKVEFKSPTPEGRIVAFMKKLNPLSEEPIQQGLIQEWMDSMDGLTIGDFEAIYRGFRFRGKVAVAELIEGLRAKLEIRKATAISRWKFGF